MKYIIKRFIESLLTVFIIMSLVFLLMRCLPVEKFFTDEELTTLDDSQVQLILEKNGLLDPPLVQLFRYLKQVIIDHDLGISRKIKIGASISSVIGDKFLYSMKFGFAGLVISITVGVICGVAQATHKDGLIDNVGLIYTIFANAVPGLVVYAVFLVIGSKYLGLPTLYSTKKPFLSAITPVICLSYSGIAGRMIWVRRYMVDELNKDYIKLATVKGLTEKQVMYRHTLRNAIVPMCSGLPAAFIHCITGSLLVEKFFSIPGMGFLLADAIGVYDYEVVQALVTLYGFLGVMGVFLGDLTLTLVDPRVRLGKKEATR